MNDRNPPSGGRKSDEAIERPNFDIVFQMGVVKLAIQDDYFCGQLVRYLSDDNDLEEYTIFDSEHLQTIFKFIVQSYHNFNNRPTEGQLRQQFNDFPEMEREELSSTLDTILNQDTHNEQYYRDYLRAYIQQVKMAKGFKKTRKVWKEHPETAPDFMQAVIDGIRRVTFDKEDVVTLKDLPTLINEGANLNSRKIPTGIKKLDLDLVGGLPRENLTVVLAGTNVGKSLFCISLGCNALRAVDENGQDRGLKVLHINLEGQRDEAVKRYAANLAQINYGNLVRGDFDEAARKRLEDVMTRFGETRLLIRNMLGFGATIEDLVAYCRELYKNFKFDIVCVDYGQLLDSKAKTEGYRFTMSRVFRGLDSISKEFSAVVVTPAQSTRGSQQDQQQEFRGRNKGGGGAETRAPVLRSTDISEAFEIARVSGVILTLNRTEEEERSQRLRLYLEKQRQGAKNILYGLITNYSQSNLITGKTYDPLEVVHDADAGSSPGGTDSIKKLAAEMKQPNLQNLPKPKPTETLTAHPVNEAEAAPAAKKAEDSEMVQFFDKLDVEFLSLRESYSKIRSAYDDLRDQDGDADVEELDKARNQLEAIGARLKEILVEARRFLGQAYPEANRELLEKMKAQLKDMKIGNAKAQDITDLERYIRHFELGLNLVKLPS